MKLTLGMYLNLSAIVLSLKIPESFSDDASNIDWTSQPERPGRGHWIGNYTDPQQFYKKTILYMLKKYVNLSVLNKTLELKIWK